CTRGSPSGGPFVFQYALDTAGSRPRAARHPTPGDRALVQLPRDVAGEIRQAAGPLRSQQATAAADQALSLIAQGEADRAVEAARRAKGLASRWASVREALGVAR